METMADPAGSSAFKSHTAKCCDICGDKGTRHALITCSRCKDSHQHLYCMRTLLLEHPKNWLCEDCDPEKAKASKVPAGNTSQRAHQVPSQSKVFPNLRRLNYISSFKDATSGKTKLLSEQDAIDLGEGAANPLIVVKRSVSRSASLKNSAAAPANELKGNYSEGQKQNSRSILRAPLKEQMQKEQAKSARCGTRLVLGKSSLGVPSAANNHGQRSIRTGSAVSRGVVLQQATAPRCTEIPSLTASWSGSCKVYNASHHLEAIHKFQAHPPMRVHEKLYEFSKSMPGFLEFELTPRCDIWVDIDQHLCRDKRDIGLYFFPVDKERWDKYDRLLEVMQEKDYVMKASIQDSELLIFTSRVLSSNCNLWGGRHFLWGLFRQVGKPPGELKKNKFLPDVEIEQEVDMTEDMDIDMIGGEEIPGRQDFVPPPPSSLPVPPPAAPQHVPPPLLRRVKPEVKEGHPLIPLTVYVPPPPPGPPLPLRVPPPPPGPPLPLRALPPPPPPPPPRGTPLRRLKLEEIPDCPPGFERRV